MALSGDQVVAGLAAAGYVRHALGSENYAEGWKSPFGMQVFVKKKAKAGPRLDSYPLVVPAELERYYSRLLAVSGVSGSNARYAHNSNYLGYGKRLHTGEKPIQYGLDFHFAEDASLARFLAELAVVQQPESAVLPDAEADIEAAQNLPETETERRAVIQARRGQGVFRELLVQRWGSCAVTGCSVLQLLRASHIQPWRDASNADRLNPNNGLLLSASLDAAFDRGLIGFDDQGQMLINTDRLPLGEAASVGILPRMRLVRIEPEHRPFLAIHRALHGF